MQTMEIKIIQQKISRQLARDIALANYGDMAKGVVDINKKIIALGGELHVDAEAVLLEHDSRQTDLWGFNFYPDKPKEIRIVYTSLINIRPHHGNSSIEILDPKLREQIKNIVDALVE